MYVCVQYSSLGYTRFSKRNRLYSRIRPDYILILIS
nr:MAG TPA: hypothetical protein [Caudoviricetes sp.]DAQ70175.1 MAG TPA: hypothetical protein [Caudoviricetes sp.]DAR85462.1 MAG TPA: hypothetical protein [Caudoviricetes sp.]